MMRYLGLIMMIIAACIAIPIALWIIGMVLIIDGVGGSTKIGPEGYLQQVWVPLLVSTAIFLCGNYLWKSKK
jgi:hypothetical protein